MSIEKRILDKLTERKDQNQLRRLIQNEGMVDFSSNDYLGLAKSCVLVDPVESGSGGSRLLTGNYRAIENLEKRIARITETEAALIYSSGYAANVGLLSCLPQRGDIILYDELVHASIRDGIRLSHAKAFSFAHNDFLDLEMKLEKWKDQNVFVVVESVYSMDGDNIDIELIKALYSKYEFSLVIDEAHSFGLNKNDPFQYELKDIIFARIVTFGKALGADGAAVLGSELLREYLINFSRSFIYSTAPSPHKIGLIDGQLDQWEDLPVVGANSRQLKGRFIDRLSNHFELISGVHGNIIGVVIGDVDKVKGYAQELQRGGFDVRPILSPTVAEGSERLRICFHEFNTMEQVDGMISLLLKIKNEVG
jgi:8-amino-7-oxononanoate synthase